MCCLLDRREVQKTDSGGSKNDAVAQQQGSTCISIVLQQYWSTLWGQSASESHKRLGPVRPSRSSLRSNTHAAVYKLTGIVRHKTCLLYRKKRRKQWIMLYELPHYSAFCSRKSTFSSSFFCCTSAFFSAMLISAISRPCLTHSCSLTSCSVARLS